MKKLLSALCALVITASPTVGAISCQTTEDSAGSIAAASIDDTGTEITIKTNKMNNFNTESIKILDKSNSGISILTINKNVVQLNQPVYRNDKLFIQYRQEKKLAIATDQCPIAPESNHTIVGAAFNSDGLSIVLQINHGQIIENWHDINIIDTLNPKLKIINYNKNTLSVNTIVHNNETVTIHYRTESNVNVKTTACPVPSKVQTIVKAEIASSGTEITITVSPNSADIQNNLLTIFDNNDHSLSIVNLKNNKIKTNNIVHNTDRLTLQYSKEIPISINTNNCPPPTIPIIDLSTLDLDGDKKYQLNLNQLRTIDDLKFDIINEFIRFNNLDDDIALLSVNNIVNQNGSAITLDKDLNEILDNESIGFIISGNDKNRYANQTYLIKIPTARKILDLSILGDIFDNKFIDKNNINDINQLSDEVYFQIEQCNNFVHVNPENTTLNLYDSDQKTPLTINNLKINKLVYFNITSNNLNKNIIGHLNNLIALIVYDSTFVNFIKDYQIRLPLHCSRDQVINTIKSAEEQDGYLFELIKSNPYYRTELFDPSKITWDFSGLNCNTEHSTFNHTQSTTFKISIFNNFQQLVNVAYTVMPSDSDFFSSYIGEDTYATSDSNSLSHSPFLIPTGKTITTAYDPIKVNPSFFTSSGINIYLLTLEIKERIKTILISNFPQIKINESNFNITFNKGENSWLTSTEALLSDNLMRQAWLTSVFSDQPSYDHNHQKIAHPAKGVFSGNATFNLFIETNQFLCINDGLHFTMQMENA